MSVKPDHSEDDEGIQGPEVTVVETNRFGFILGNGEIDSDGPCPEIVRHRESKWLSLMTQWEQVMEKKSNKVKGQCQKGIPASVRAKGWPLLCGAKERKDKNIELYERLAEAPDHQGWTDIIKRDTDRQFPFHEMFQSKDGHGQKDLLEVLKAYTQYRPDEGYCQAQGPVAAVLLMNMPAEEAFWCLVQISELYLPGYYSPLLEGVLFDAAVLSSVLKKLCPAAHKHLQNQGVEPLMFATDWLMCLYSRHLPFNTLLRVWDLFFCYGVRVLFQVAVVFVRRCLGEGRQRKECDGQMETLERLRGVKERIQNEQTDAFIHEVCSVSLSSADLQKQTEKELEKWKKERPNSTFDPRGRCHGYRMAWERAHDKQKELEKKERQKGSLSLPVMRSHSSLSPSLMRKKWRKRSSKTDTEEWDGGGRKFSRSVMEESENEELRRRSVCGIVGEQRAKQDRLADEFCTRKHKDHNTHPNISVVVSSSIDCDVFEKQHTETPLNQQKGDSETTETAGCVVEESIQTHHHELQTEKDTNTEAPTNQNEQNTDKQTVEITRTLEPCKEITPAEKEDTQADFSKQEEEMQPDSNIQEVEIQTEHGNQQEETEDWLPQVIISEDNQQTKDNIPENFIVQEEQRCQTSRGQYEEHEHTERQKEKELHLPTVKEEDKETQLISADVDSEKGFSQEFNNPLKETGDTLDLPEVCEEEGRQNISLDQRETCSSADEEALQTSEEVSISSSLQTEQESNSEHPDMQQSQSRNPEHNDMDAIVTDVELVHCPVTSTQGVKAGSGNLQLNEMNVADATTTLEPQEEEATAASLLSTDTGMGDSAVATSDDIETSENNPETSEENKSTLPEKTVCCKDSLTTEESCSLTQTDNNVPVTSESGKPESNVLEPAHGSPERNDVHVITESGHPEINKTDVTTESEIPESNDLQIAVVYGNSKSDIKGSAVENPESYQVPTTGSGNVEDEVIGCDPPETNREHVNTGSNPACNPVHWTDESGNPETNAVYSTVCNPENSNVLVTTEFENPQCSNAPITSETSESTTSDSSVVDLSVESINQDNEVNVPTGPEKPQTKEMEIAVASGNSECNIMGSTFENPERIPVLVTIGSGNPESNDVHVKTESGNPESNIETLAVGPGNPDQLETREHDTGGSGNPEYDKGDSAESGNPHNLECAIPANSQALDSPSSIPSSKSPNPNVPPAQLRVRRTSSSRVYYPTILSEDTFKEPQQQGHTHSKNMTHTLSQDTHVTPSLPTKVDAPKRLGLFRRLRGETNKATVPKILIQDFSEKDERLTAKERRRRKREKERKEREEKDRKKLEKEMEKDKAKDRKKPQTRGKSFQVPSRKCADNVVSPRDCDSQTSHPRRNSAPFSDSYF